MRLLVIEDNQNLVANLFDYFEARGHVLDAAPDGVTGLHLASTQPYDVVVLDWMLPRMDGQEVLRLLREKQDSGVPVILLHHLMAVLDDWDPRVIDGIAALILLVPILLPVATQVYGINPYHFGVVICINLTLGLLTPPVGTALYVAARVTGATPAEILRPLMPLLVVTLLILILLCWQPYLVTALID